MIWTTNTQFDWLDGLHNFSNLLTGVSFVSAHAFAASVAMNSHIYIAEDSFCFEIRQRNYQGVK